MKKITTPGLFLSFGLLLSPAVFANEVVADKIKSSFPDAPLKSVLKTPIKDLYEVSIGTDVIYMTHDAKYMFLGSLIDFESKVSLSEERKTVLRSDILRSMRDEDMVIYAPEGDIKYTLTVFTDPSCVYCRKLHNEIPELVKQGVKVRYVLTPRSGLSSPAGVSSVGIMCSEDKKTYTDKVFSGETIKVPSCDTHRVLQNMEVANDMGMQGTPFMLTETGAAISGYRPAANIMDILNKTKMK